MSFPFKSFGFYERIANEAPTRQEMISSRLSIKSPQLKFRILSTNPFLLLGLLPVSHQYFILILCRNRRSKQMINVIIIYPNTQAESLLEKPLVSLESNQFDDEASIKPLLNTAV